MDLKALFEKIYNAIMGIFGSQVPSDDEEKTNIFEQIKNFFDSLFNF